MTDPVTTLRAERQRVEGHLRALRSDFDGMLEAARLTNADDEHDPEGATLAFERTQLAALIRQGQERLAEIEASLARIANGSYGRCMECGAPIPDGRLEARPTARTCVACA